MHCLKNKRWPATDKIYQKNFRFLSFKTEPKIRILVILWNKRIVTQHNSRDALGSSLKTVKENTAVKREARAKGSAQRALREEHARRDQRKQKQVKKGKLETIWTQSLFNYGHRVDFSFCFELYQKSNTVLKHRELLACVWLFVTRVGQLSTGSLKAHHQSANWSLQRWHMRRRLIAVVKE